MTNWCSSFLFSFFIFYYFLFFLFYIFPTWQQPLLQNRLQIKKKKLKKKTFTRGCWLILCNAADKNEMTYGGTSTINQLIFIKQRIKIICCCLERVLNISGMFSFILDIPGTCCLLTSDLELIPDSFFFFYLNLNGVDCSRSFLFFILMCGNLVSILNSSVI